MTKRIAIFGGSFNPPAEHHREIASVLTKTFDEVIILPCGPRPDKPQTNDIDPVHRATMADLAFRDIPKTRVELFDLESATFTRNHEFSNHFSGELWHVVGTDLVRGGKDRQSLIQTTWQQGEELWTEAKFAVCVRKGYPAQPEDLPSNSETIEITRSGSSAEIREKLFHREPVGRLVSPAVAEYIERHALYRGAPARSMMTHVLRSDQMTVIRRSEDRESDAIAKKYPESETPEAFLVIGGDGTMLHAIRSHWRERLPFYGINTGHLGFLLNDRSSRPKPGVAYVVQHLPLLYVEMEHRSGKRSSGYAFNDCWVERQSGQSAWMQVEVNGEPAIENLIGDGALVATPAGSSSYALAMGASPLPIDTKVILLVGSNVFRPLGWKQAALSFSSTVTIRASSPERRPLSGYLDGVPQGEVVSLTARVSRIAAVELMFEPGMDSAAKLAKIQFPGLAGNGS